MVYGVSSISRNQEKIKNVPVLLPSRAAGDTLPKERRINVCVCVCVWVLLKITFQDNFYELSCSPLSIFYYFELVFTL